jgi:hypothetical protein
MAQLSKGTTYTAGGSVTDTNLNAHVDSAVLLVGAIGEQTAATTVATTDTLPMSVGGALRKVALSDLLKVAPVIGGTTPAAVTATTLVSTTLQTGVANVTSLTSSTSVVGALSVSGTSLLLGALTSASTASFAGPVSMNGGANLGNASSDAVVLNCTLSGTLKGEPVVDVTTVTAASGDKVLIQDASDASKLKLAAFPSQYVKAFVRANSSGTILGTAFNVTSVVRASDGVYTVTFTTPMASANYVALATSGVAAVVVSFAAVSTGVCTVASYLPSSGYYNAGFSLVIFEV